MHNELDQTSSKPNPLGKSAPRRTWWHVAGRTFALTVRLLPIQYRYPLACRLARLLEPLVARTEMARDQLKRRVDGIREISLYAVLRALAESGVSFEAALRIEQIDLLKAAATNPRGLLLTTAHTMLSSLVVRTLYPLGVQPLVIALDPEEWMCGKVELPRSVQPSPTCLLTVRSELQSGGTVVAAIDQDSPVEGRTVRVETELGPLFIADSILRVACRSLAQILFVSVRFDEKGELVASIKAPAVETEYSPAHVTAEFAAFVQSHVAAQARVGCTV